MSIRENQKIAQEFRQGLRAIAETLYTRQNRLRHKQNQLASALRQGEAGRQTAGVLRREIKRLQAQLELDISTHSAARARLAETLQAFPAFDQPWELVEHLPDNLPFLLFPVRIETRFMTVSGQRELWVRVFPDDIAIFTHEKILTPDEVEMGQKYWQEFWKAIQESDPDVQESLKKGAWRALAEAYGSTRAAWIANQTEPASLGVTAEEGLAFPEFDPETLKSESWSQAPRTNIMPDRFVFMGIANGDEVFRRVGNPIPDPLMLGPDPQKLEDEFQQQDGELLVGEDIAWIYDFNKAIEAGMGMRIPLEEPYASQGLERLYVLGLRLSSDERENQTLLEELFENHRYAPDGMGLLPQGTPTNNTDDQGSGFSSSGLDAETSFALETGEVLFTPAAEPFEKTDGQYLAEALGIDFEPLQRVHSANQLDFQEAVAMNKALWHGTLGYYLEEMLGLDLDTVGLPREFFTDYVTGRGPLPALRVGAQPYGVLVTSDFSTWQWSRKLDGNEFPFLSQLYNRLKQMEGHWIAQIPAVPRVGASGDPLENLLRMLGLHATSVEFHRRNAVGKEYIWNYEAFNLGTFFGRLMMTQMEQQARQILDESGLDFEKPPKLFDLAFFLNQDAITDPLVDDISAEQVEKLSEGRLLPDLYQAPDPANPDASLPANYITWLLRSDLKDLKTQRFEDLSGDPLPVPRALLYRTLRGALLQSHYDASMRLYTTFDLLPVEARREVELGNIEVERTVTRWEFMEADVSQVIPQLSQESQSIGRFLLTEQGLNRPEALSLREVRACLETLENLPTARLERVFIEHLDLCTYRLDAWQTGCFYRRLLQQRLPLHAAVEDTSPRVQGIYLGAFGWLEDLRPGPALTPVKPGTVPISLHDSEKDGSLFVQPNNGGFIHGPSLNHAVAAAVLRNAYLTHYDSDNPEKMAVNLSSERVRTALFFLDGIRNGQELGALLGYQFERGLQDRHGDPSLSQFMPFLRQQYPLVADKITPDEENQPIETKETLNVLDGYALVEATILKEPPLPYPYGVSELPLAGSAGATAIQDEVNRMADSLDSIQDLALAEAVFQVTQGNFDRAGAMLKTLTEGNNPPEPEIVRTPRSGAALTLRATLHLETGSGITSPWPGTLTGRANIEPGLNKWLGDWLPTPDKIQFNVQAGEAAPEPQSLSALGLQPIDLVYLIGDELADETTELENRIAYHTRRSLGDDSLPVNIAFMAELSDPEGITLFALLPLLRRLRDLVTGCRPLAADDFGLPSETTTNPEEDPNPQGADLGELKTRVETALAEFKTAVDNLGFALPLDGDGNPDPGPADAELLRQKLLDLAAFGLPDAVPHSATGNDVEARTLLVNQASNILNTASSRLTRARENKTNGDVLAQSTENRIGFYQAAAQAVFGAAFNLIPVFSLKNQEELQTATAFRDAIPALSLTRFHADNPLVVEEWLQGAAKVREKLNKLEAISIFGQALERQLPAPQPLQLPFRESDHWIAVEYPEVLPADLGKPETFVPEGEFLSLVQWLPASGFDPSQPQSGLLIDEWTEVIPGRQETTGIAIHYNQPNTEPPQTLLLAVTPQITGAWNWGKLVGILDDTLERAKMRAVEPDQLGRTAFGHLLPAVLSAVTSYPHATISTDFVHQTALKALNLANQDG